MLNKFATKLIHFYLFPNMIVIKISPTTDLNITNDNLFDTKFMIMQKVSMYTIKTINMINCSLYMNNDSSYVIVACDNAEFCSVSRRTKYYLLMMVVLLSCYYILY